MIPGIVASQAVQIDEAEQPGELAGEIVITLTPSADLFVLAEGELIGTSSFAITPSASLAAAVGLSGTSSFTMTPSANLGGMFIPTDLGSALEGWYDFSDTATISATSNLIDSITDKSGNANTLTGTSTSRPGTGVQTLNGYNVATFDGTDDVLSKASPTGLPNQFGGMTLLCLRLYTSGTAGGLIWLRGQGGAHGEVGILGRDGGNMGIWGDNLTNSAGKVALFADSDNTNWHLSSGTHTEPTRVIFHDGTQQNTNSVALGGAQNPDTLLIGHALSVDRLSNRFFPGRMAEVIILSGTDTTNRQKCEGYLMWKYGLQANLPGGHPYASSPP